MTTPSPTAFATRTTYEVWYRNANGDWTHNCSRTDVKEALTQANVYKAKGIRSMIVQATRSPIFDTHPE